MMLRAELDGLTFQTYSSGEIEKLAVVNITQPQSLDILGNAVHGGVYDSRMGPYNSDLDADLCGTCRQSIDHCPGHLGCIRLHIAVYNPLLQTTLLQVLKAMCLNCCRFKANGIDGIAMCMVVELVDAGYLQEASEVKQMIRSNVYDWKGDDAHISDDQKCNTILDEVQKVKKKCHFNEKTCSRQTRLVTQRRQAEVDSFLNRCSISKKCQHCLVKHDHSLVFHESQFIIMPKHKEPKLPSSKKKKGKDVVPDDDIVREEAEAVADEDSLSHAITNSKKKISLLPSQVKKYIHNLWNRENSLLQTMFKFDKNHSFAHPSDVFFMDVIAVTPPKCRPMNIVGAAKVEHPQSTLYKNIVYSNNIIKEMFLKKEIQDPTLEKPPDIRRPQDPEKTEDAIAPLLQRLINDVNKLLDAEKGKLSKVNTEMEGLKQILEKKEGIMRMHMMGKRVNYACRSVITPDPHLAMDEIGIPQEFAKQLTFPEYVTSHNDTMLRDAVMNGPDVHPGAMAIEDGSGKKMRLLDRNRTVIANSLLAKEVPGDGDTNKKPSPKIVHRHLRNGDVLLLNRQPSLHKPSIMAHKIRVLTGEKTLRLHYANCKAYNADFDGDEMNAHCPQSYLGRAEAYNIANVCRQYLVPKDGTPLSGLIQDHVVAGVRLSIRGKFFTKSDYQQLVYGALVHHRGSIVLLPPTMMKPAMLWSGKQIISTLLINLTPHNKQPIQLTSKAKISKQAWQSGATRDWTAGGTGFTSHEMSESEVVIREGELLCGVLDKEQFGATTYGLVHCFYEVYGGEYSGALLTAFSRLFTNYLHMEGFSLGIADVLLRDSANRKRVKHCIKSHKIGDLAAAEAFSTGSTDAESIKRGYSEAHLSTDKHKLLGFDHVIKQQYLDPINNKINSICLPSGLLKQFPLNNLQLMVQSGAKGSIVNTMQISSLLGQIELEGKRPPLMLSGRCLPSFPAYCTSPRSRGFITGRFLTGIRPQEFFFHCMAGREGLIDTAVKTSRSGYLQRCLIKMLEGIVVGYDMTVRDSEGSVIQFQYGEDGLDVAKIKFLQPKLFNFLLENKQSIVNKQLIAASKSRSNKGEVQETKKQIDSWNSDHLAVGRVKKRSSAFLSYCQKKKHKAAAKNIHNPESFKSRDPNYHALQGDFTRLSKTKLQSYETVEWRRPDPITSTFTAAAHYGVISERLDALLKEYITNNKVREKSLTSLVYQKAVESVCEAGEPVGLLAAQSIGEPSTQMTLNTFHFAGRGEMNVTLGIPRLKELLMVASKKLKTPSMEIPLSTTGERDARHIQQLMRRVTLSHVLTSVDVHDTFIYDKHKRGYEFAITFNVLEKKVLQQEFNMKVSKVLAYLESSTFIKQLLTDIYKAAGKRYNAIETAGADSADYDSADDEDAPADKPEEQDSELDDDDATAVRNMKRHNDEIEYEPEETAVTAEAGEGGEEEIEPSQPTTTTEAQQLEAIKLPATEFAVCGKKEERKKYVVDNHSAVESYDFDESSQHAWATVKLHVPLEDMAMSAKLDIAAILRRLCERRVLREVEGITRAVLIDNNTGGHTIQTEGVNLLCTASPKLAGYASALDMNRCSSNDIHSMASVFGIEAARTTIVKEVQKVFGVYGITVDIRHLYLIADAMTWDGTYQPFNRTGMRAYASPIQQMTFETTLQFLTTSLLAGSRDELRSPSSRITVGKPSLGGTGSFQILHQYAAAVK